MSDDRVCTVYDVAVITTFVEHTHIYAKYACKEYSTACSTLIRADDHQMVIVDLDVIYAVQDAFYELVSRLNGIESVKRDRILYTRIMCIEGDDVVNTHADQLLKCQCAVHGLTCSTSVLTALIQERHDNSDSSCFTICCSDHTFQILIVIIR